MAKGSKKKIMKGSTSINSGCNEKFGSEGSNHEEDHVDNINITSPHVNLNIYSSPVRNNNSQVAVPSVIQQIHIYCNHHDESSRPSESTENNEHTYLLPIPPPIFGNQKFYFKDNLSKENFEKTDKNNQTPRSKRNSRSRTEHNIRKMDENNETSCSKRNCRSRTENNIQKMDENNETPRSGRSCRNVLEDNIKKTDENNVTLFSKSNCKNDVQRSGRKSKVSDNPQPDNLKNKIVHYNLRNDKNKNLEKQSEDVPNNTQLSKYNGIKLKKALVILKDISKSNAWHHLVIGHAESEFRNKSPSDSLKQTECQKDCSEGDRSSIKHEILSLPSSSPVREYLSNSALIDNSFESIGGEIKSQGIIVSTPTTQEPLVRCERLTAAAEGCNFSEILSKFRGSDSQCLLDSVKNSGNDESNIKCSEPDEASDDCYNDTTKDNSFEETFKSDRESDSGSSNDVNGNTSYKARHSSFDDEPSAQIIKDNAKVKADKTESLRETVKKDSDPECLVKEYCVTDSASDKYNICSEEHSTSEAVVDFESFKKESPFKISPKHNSNLEVSKTKYNSVIDVGNIDLQLQLIRKEIQRRNCISFGDSKMKRTPKMKKKPDTREEKPEKSTPPKKPKLIKKKSKKEIVNSSGLDYIPLNAPGSTKFVVAPLNAIDPYKSHPAKTFKKEMLFGKRVARFSSSEVHRMYQLKRAERKLVRK